MEDLNVEKNEEDTKKRALVLNEFKKTLSLVENCGKWFKEFGPFESEDLESVLKICGREFEEFAQRKLANESDLKYSAIETIAKRCIQIQILVENNDTDAAQSYIVESFYLIKECVEKRYFSNVYAKGLRFVINCLEITVKLKVDEAMSLHKLEGMLNDLKAFNSFNNMDKAAVLALKQYFLGNVKRDAHDTQIRIIKEMIELDPMNLEWRICLYALNLYKRGKSQNKYEPTNEEKTAIIEAKKLPGAQHDPRIRLGYIRCLADLTFSASKSGSSMIFFGTNTFFSCREAVDFIRNEADEILAIDPMSVKSNVNIAKIFSSILPKQFRNTEFSRICLDRALLFHPGSSKANHRMALLMLSTQRIDEAVKYLEKAFEGDERNVFAVNDLIKAYLGSPKHHTQLQQLLDKLLDHPNYKYNVEKQAEFLYLRSLNKFFEGDSSAGIRLLIDSYKKSSNITKQFKDIDNDQRRYQWSKENFFQNEFQMLLSRGEALTMDFAEKVVLRSILNSFLASRPSGRGGGGFGFGNQGFRGSNSNYSSYGSRNNSYGNNNNFHGSYKRSQHDYGSSHKEKDYNHHQSSKTSMNKDNWNILGVPKTATQDEIKKAYKKLAIEFHPDKNMHLTEVQRKEKQEKMKQINVAYETLVKNN